MTETTAPAGYDGWAIVELMGHRQRAGLVREAEMFGTKLLRIDIPLVPPKPEPPRLEWVQDDIAFRAQWQEHLFQVSRGDGATWRIVYVVGGTTTRNDRAFHTSWEAKRWCQDHMDALMPPPPPDPPLASLPAATEYYGGSAIYALRPCTEEVARAAILRIGDPRPAAPLGYRLASGDTAPRQLAYAGEEE